MQLPNGVIITDEQEIEVMGLYNYKCVLHPERWLTCIHHEPPRSLNPRYKEQPLTWFPTCATCHPTLHSIGRKIALALLKEKRDQNYPGVKEKICQMYPTAE